MNVFQQYTGSMADQSFSQQQATVQAESRRHVAVLFTDLSDSTRLSGTMEAETYAAMLDEVRHAFRTAVETRGGVVNQYQGDGLQALFGHAEPSEHDGRRAAEAAVEVHAFVRAVRSRYVSEGAGALSVHSGLHSGQALVRPGDSVAGRIELFGPAPGIAKHLSDSAEPDEILVSDETLGPAAKLFNTGSPRSVLLKGRSEPLVVRCILSRSAVRTRFEAQSQRGLVSFVGRDAELSRLEHMLAEVLQGQLRFGLVSAPAGVGKTRLAEEFLRLALRRGCTVLRGCCDTELSAEPLQPFLQMLRTQLQIAPEAQASAVVQAIEAGLVELDPALVTFKSDLLQVLSVGPQALPAARLPAAHTLRALNEVIAALARRGPLVLFIDDWQWADDATRQLLYAVCGGNSLPMLLLAATRPSLPGEPDPSMAQRIELAPFGEEEALATVDELLPGADPFVTGQIVRQAGGNPLFIEELCHFAARAGKYGVLQPAQGGPAWLETLIASRVARLPSDQRRVIDAAAVIGTQVPAWLLEHLTGCAASHPLVTALAAQDLLFPTEDAGLLRFKHGITRDVVYGAIGLQARRASHRHAASLLAKPDDPAAEAQACEALAYHWSGAGEHARAARCAAMAGDKAMQASSIDRAKAQYRAALESMDRLPHSPQQYQDWRSAVRKLGMASVFDPSRADLPWFERAAALADERSDKPGLGFACYWRSYISYALGDSRAAVEHGAAAMAAAESAGDARLVTQVRAIQGQALAACGEGVAAEALLDDTLLRMGQIQHPGDRPATPGLAFTMACRASVLADRGRFDKAQVGFALALEASPSPGHEVEASVLCLRSNMYLWQGHWQDAASDAAAAEQVAERVRSLYLLAMSRALGAWAHWKAWQISDSGPPPLKSIQVLREATAWLIARDVRLFISLNQGRLAEALTTLGEHVPARHHAAEALRRWRERDPLGAPTALRALAREAMSTGQPGLALRRLALAERVASARDSAHEHVANARCRADLGLA